MSNISSTMLLNAHRPDKPGFEGPEKILEVDFIPIGRSKSSGSESDVDFEGNYVGPSMRSVDRKTWDAVLSEARCTILSVKSNEYFDAYVLSESSLFVYDRKAYMKTCGTTTLLRCLSSLLAAAKSVGLELEWVGYSRKDFLYPDKQVYPHCSFEQEVNFAQKACIGPKGVSLQGGAFVLGDIISDHWFVYVADYNERSCATALDVNINIMMYDLDPAVTRIFFKKPGEELEEAKLRVRKETNLSSIEAMEGGIYDDFVFDPCGYSLNVLVGEAFFTVHVTPEAHCCYASFETNVEVHNYEKMMQQVLQVFKPKRFTVAVFADKAGLQNVEKSPVDYKILEDVGHPAVVGKGEMRSTFKRISTSTTVFATDYVCQLANFILKGETDSSDDDRSRSGDDWE